MRELSYLIIFAIDITPYLPHTDHRTLRIFLDGSYA